MVLTNASRTKNRLQRRVAVVVGQLSVTASANMAETPRKIGDFKGVGHFEAKLNLGWRVIFRDNIYGPLDRGMAIL